MIENQLGFFGDDVVKLVKEMTSTKEGDCPELSEVKDHFARLLDSFAEKEKVLSLLVN